jgi:hypothetical protein
VLNQALRYAPVIGVLPAPGSTLLEVGSGSHGIAPYLSDGWSLTACDVAFDDYGADRVGGGEGVQRVRASVLDLPFADSSFNAVVALDLLEHLPPEDRRSALKELRRVAAELLVVGCPCGAEAEGADRRLAEFYNRLGKPHPGWLSEHLRYGLPDAGFLLTAARPGDRTELVANCNLTSHERVMRCEALPIVWRGPTAIARSARWFLRRSRRRSQCATRLLSWIGGGDRAPTYRQIAFITTNAARR